MANLQKYKKTQTGGLFRHFERARKKDGSFYQFGNQNINTAMTYLNYNLCAREESQSDFLNRRLKELNPRMRKDLNVFASWVITAPSDLPSKREEEFFRHAYNFLNNRYGNDTEKNVISCYIHLDETTPHMHYAFVPVALDKKKKREKLSARDVLNRQDLRTFHTDLQKYIYEKMGEKYAILLPYNQASAEKKEFVQKKLDEEIKELESKWEALRKMDNTDFIKFLKNFKKTFTGKYNLTEKELKGLWESNYKNIPAERVEDLKKDLKNLKNKIKKINERAEVLSLQNKQIKKQFNAIKRENIKLKGALGKMAKGKILLDKIYHEKEKMDQGRSM